MKEALETIIIAKKRPELQPGPVCNTNQSSTCDSSACDRYAAGLISLLQRRAILEVANASDRV